MSAIRESFDTRCALRELDAADYARALPLLASPGMNTLFARAVLVGEAPGRVFADSAASPSVAHVIHGYGMSLLCGDVPDAETRAAVVAQVLGMRRADAEWLQVSSDAWADAVVAQATDAVTRYTRVNFAFSAELYARRRPGFVVDPHCRVARADRSAFAMPGTVVPRAFWTGVDRFLEAGVGFAALVDGELAALAFSAFVTPTQLEIGIETLERYRGRGLATLACAALIDHCLAHRLEPVWACRLENTGSFRLAEAIGFTPTRYLPYFRLAADGA